MPANLRDYVRHLPSCHIATDGNGEYTNCYRPLGGCDCGLDAVLSSSAPETPGDARAEVIERLRKALDTHRRPPAGFNLVERSLLRDALALLTEQEAELAALRTERANLAEAIGLPREAGDIASCDVVTHHAAGMHAALIAANEALAALRAENARLIGMRPTRNCDRHPWVKASGMIGDEWACSDCVNKAIRAAQRNA